MPPGNCYPSPVRVLTTCLIPSNKDLALLSCFFTRYCQDEDGEGKKKKKHKSKEGKDGDKSSKKRSEGKVRPQRTRNTEEGEEAGGAEGEDAPAVAAQEPEDDVQSDEIEEEEADRAFIDDEGRHCQSAHAKRMHTQPYKHIYMWMHAPLAHYIYNSTKYQPRLPRTAQSLELCTKLKYHV